MKRAVLKRWHINCPDWMDKPLMTFFKGLSVVLVICYIAFVICLAILYSPWFLLMFLLTPTLSVKKDPLKDELKDEQEKLKRLEQWKQGRV